MKAHVRDGKPTFELDVPNNSQVDMFKLLAKTQEVFGESCCGLCKETQLTFMVRTVEENDYFELKCESCFAKLTFGQSKKKPGELFPRRKLTAEGKPCLETGKYGNHRGWTKYSGEKKTEEEAAPPPKKPAGNGKKF